MYAIANPAARTTAEIETICVDGEPGNISCIQLAEHRIRVQKDEIIGTNGKGDRLLRENQRYSQHPMLLKEEIAGMNALRRRADQFYP